MAKLHLKHQWVRPRPLEMYKKEPGFHYRWVRRNNVQRKKYEGYVVVRADKKHKKKSTKRFGNAIKFNELILMRLPMKMKKARNRHFQEKTDRAMKAITTLNRKQRRDGLVTLKRLGGEDRDMVDPVMEESVR